jgi:hypothetical protein
MTPFRRLGNLARSAGKQRVCGGLVQRARPEFKKFPVISPVSREFGPETGSIQTASSGKLLGPWRSRMRFEP